MLCCLTQFCISQNLLPNPSFEEVNTCYKYHKKCSPKAWRPTTLKSFRYNEFLGDRHKVKPPDGNRYISLIMYSEKKAVARKFIQAPLLCPLIAGKQYRFSLYFKTQYKVLSRFGVYFPTQLKILKNNSSLLEVHPQIIFSGDENMEVNHWQKLEASFTATGKEQGIIIGNFFSAEQTQIKILKKISRKQLKNNPPPSITYYSFDHLSLIAQDSSTSDCDMVKNLTFIYRDTTRHIFKDKPLIIANLPIVTTIDSNLIQLDTFKEKLQTLPSPSRNLEIPIESSFVLKNILFENNSAVLISLAYSSLDKILSVLEENPSYRLRIIGHTDAIGSTVNNLILSQQRAKIIAQFLIAKGISSSRLEAIGKGETQAISSNRTTEARRKNRRVEFLILK